MIRAFVRYQADVAGAVVGKWVRLSLLGRPRVREGSTTSTARLVFRIRKVQRLKIDVVGHKWLPDCRLLS